MFSSLKLNSLKCQSNGGSDKKNKCGDDDDDDVSDHMYEKLPNFDNKPCKCHLNHIKRSPKQSKPPFGKRISKWRMECPSITNFRNSRPDDDPESKNNQEERNKEMPNLERIVRTKVTSVNIQREDGNLGITLRGGFHQNADLSRPVTITYLKPDGPAAREGTIKPGDRLLAVDGISLQGSSLVEAQTLLRQPSASTLLTIEYDVSVLDSVEHASGPLLVEIERTLTQQLGLTLFQNEDGIIIERVKPGSLADRCGALHEGDEILAVNATRIEGASIALEDVMRILECECPIVRLEILPSYALSCYSNYGTWKAREHALSLGSTLSGVSTLKGSPNRKNRDLKKEELLNGFDYKRTHKSSKGFCGAEIAVTHCETLNTTLARENGSFGIQFVDAPDGSVLINSVTPGGPAERCQCLHAGDRVLFVNQRSIALENLTAKDINTLLEFKSDEVSSSKLNLHTEFDVLDAVVPASGIFTVKLAKRGAAGLGITMTASKSSGFIICEMKKGSIAHRAGSLVPGDKLLAINNIPLDQCSVEYAAHILHQSTNIVTLKVQREENNSDFRSSRKITYTVDLQKYGGPLGITIAGSEDLFQPITISGLTPGGLAEQTGVIHIGDEILAINNHSLYGEPLSKAHDLLQSSSDLVTLKISRSIVPICRTPSNRSPVLPSSIDSAVESWDSSHLDLTSPDHQKTFRNSRDGTKRNPSLAQQKQTIDTSFLSAMTENPEITSATNNNGNNSDLAILDEITSENLKIKHELDMLSIKLDEQRKSKLQKNTNAEDVLANCGADTSNRESVPQFSEKLGSQNGMNDVQSPCENNCYENRGEVKFLDISPKDREREYEGRESFTTNDFENFEMAYMPETRNWCTNQYFGSDSNQGSIRSEFQSSQLYEVTLYKDPIYEDFGFSVSDGLYERGVFINRIRKGGPADLSNVLKPYDRILQVNETYTQDFDCCLTVPLIASAGDSLVLLVARNSGSCNSENEVFENEKFYNQGMTLSTTKLGPSNHVNYKELKRILV